MRQASHSLLVSWSPIPPLLPAAHGPVLSQDGVLEKNGLSCQQESEPSHFLAV